MIGPALAPLLISATCLAAAAIVTCCRWLLVEAGEVLLLLGGDGGGGDVTNNFLHGGVPPRRRDVDDGGDTIACRDVDYNHDDAYRDLGECAEAGDYHNRGDSSSGDDGDRLLSNAVGRAMLSAAASPRLRSAPLVLLLASSVALFVGVVDRVGTQEGARVGMQCTGVQLLGGQLFHDLTQVHNQHTITKVFDHLEVVGDEQNR